MSHAVVRLICLVVGVATTHLMTVAVEPIATSMSSDNYQTAWLELEAGGVALEGKAGDPFDARLFLGLRDGRAVTAWFANAKLAGPRIVWLDQTTLKFDGKSLRGELRGRTNLNWGSKNVHDYVYLVNAAMSNGSIPSVWRSRANIYLPRPQSKRQLTVGGVLADAALFLGGNFQNVLLQFLTFRTVTDDPGKVSGVRSSSNSNRKRSSLSRSDSAACLPEVISRRRLS